MKITIVGCGNMGLVYARAFLKYNIVTKESLLLVEKNEVRKEELKKLDIGRVVVPDDNTISESDVIILAVKPQDFSELAGQLKKVLNGRTVLLSIMAGVTIKKLEEVLKHKIIIRAMPNSPVEIGLGVTAYSSSAGLSHDVVKKAENLLSTTGRSIYFENEEMLDAVTAISGSGPAYFFYFVKTLIEAAKQMGMDEGTAGILVKQTMLGSFHLINNANKSLDDLIKTVASKGGTTEAALQTFNDAKVNEHIVEGLLNAERRAKELSAML
jgi:pyrroline-5-carboxylate reductase